jgi:hypothetical protein
MTYGKRMWLVGYYEGLVFFSLLVDELMAEGREEMIGFYVDEHVKEVEAGRVEMDGEDYRRGYQVGFEEGYRRMVMDR